MHLSSEEDFKVLRDAVPLLSIVDKKNHNDDFDRTLHTSTVKNLLKSPSFLLEKSIWKL